MNRFNLSRILVPLFVLFLIVAALYSSYQIFPEVKKAIDSVVPWLGSDNKNQSTFGNLDVIEVYEPERTQVVELYFNFLKESDAYSQENNANSPYWQNWNWQTHFFWAYVSRVDIEQRMLDLQFGAPETFGKLSN